MKTKNYNSLKAILNSHSLLGQLQYFATISGGIGKEVYSSLLLSALLQNSILFPSVIFTIGSLYKQSEGPYGIGLTEVSPIPITAAEPFSQFKEPKAIQASRGML